MLAVAAGACRAQTADAAEAWSFDAVLTTHLMDNTRGGLRQGAQAINDIEATATWQGDHGWTAFADLQVTNNDGFSANYVGDYQVVSNADLPTGIHLGEAWVAKASDGQHFNTTLGLVSVNNVFDVQDAGALFLNASHGIGIDFSQSAASAKPLSALGVIEEWTPRDDVRLRAGLFDAVGGDPEHDKAFVAAHLSRAEGLQYQVEAEKDFTGGYVKLGHWANTAPADPLDGAGPRRRYSGTYGQIKLTLFSEKTDADQGLQGWLRAGVASAHVLPVAQYTGGGLVYTGLVPGRDHDQFGFAIACARFGSPYEASVGEPATAETTYELAYQYEVKPGFIVQPDVQYVQHPSGLHSVKDAVVVGVAIRIGLADLLARQAS